MSPAVVDSLEVVDVQHQDREGTASALGAADLLLKRFLEMPMVVRPGQSVPDALLPSVRVGPGDLDGGDRLVGEDLEGVDRLQGRGEPISRSANGQAPDEKLA